MEDQIVYANGTVRIACDNAISLPTPRLTDLEKRTLLAYAETEYGDGLGSSTWVFSIVDHSGLTGRQVGGILSNLQKKGLVRVTAGFGGEEAETRLTDAGVTAVERLQQG